MERRILLFQSNMEQEQSQQLQQKLVQLMVKIDINYKIQDIPFHMRIQAHDKEDYLLIDHLNQCILFIEQARKFTNVFVHCYAGVSRSVAVICAYIMSKFMWDFQTTYAFVLSKRIVAKPNEGFKKQLLQFQALLFQNQSYLPVPLIEDITNINKKQSLKNISNQNSFNSINGSNPNKKQIFQQKFVQKTIKEQKSLKFSIPQPSSYNFSNSGMNFKSPEKNHNDKNGLSQTHKNHFGKQQNISTAMSHQIQPENFINMQNKNSYDNFSLKSINSSTRTSFNSSQQQFFKPQDRILGGKKQIYNHNSIPIPKLVLGESGKQMQTNKFYSTQQSFNSKKMFQQLQSPKKISMKNNQIIKNSPRLQNSSLYTKSINKIDVNQMNFQSKRQSMELSKQKNKVVSRCMIKPKDLPGYKNYN